jgi:hypothetical protein
MSTKKSNVLLEVDRSIIENNLLIQVNSIQITPKYKLLLQNTFTRDSMTNITNTEGLSHAPIN